MYTCVCACAMRVRLKRVHQVAGRHAPPHLLPSSASSESWLCARREREREREREERKRESERERTRGGRERERGERERERQDLEAGDVMRVLCALLMPCGNGKGVRVLVSLLLQQPLEPSAVAHVA